jgi:hypothetical protein
LELPGYVEFIEIGQGFLGWDGADPVRSFI